MGKIYIFNIKKKHNHNYMSILEDERLGNKDSEWSVYAITRKKKHYKAFKKFRNMKMFREEIIDEDVESIWKKLMENYRSCLLDERELKTKRVNTSGKYEITIVNFILTDFEYQTSTISGEEMSELVYLNPTWWEGCIPLKYISESRMKKALKYLSYENMRMEMVGAEDWDPSKGSSFCLDEFCLFLAMYRDLMME